MQNLSKIEDEFDDYKRKLNEDKQMMQRIIVQKSVSSALAGKITLESLIKQENIKKKRGKKERKSTKINVQNVEDDKKNPFGIKDQGGSNKLQSRNSLRKKSQEEEKNEESD